MNSFDFPSKINYTQSNHFTLNKEYANQNNYLLYSRYPHRLRSNLVYDTHDRTCFHEIQKSTVCTIIQLPSQADKKRAKAEKMSQANRSRMRGWKGAQILCQKFLITVWRIWHKCCSAQIRQNHQPTTTVQQSWKGNKKHQNDQSKFWKSWAQKIWLHLRVPLPKSACRYRKTSLLTHNRQSSNYFKFISIRQTQTFPNHQKW